MSLNPVVVNVDQKNPDKNAFGFPSDFIDPEKKQGKDYNIQYAKAAYEMYTTDNTLITFNRRTNFISNRLYAEGNQDNAKYQKWMTTQDSEGENVSYANIDYTPVSPIPKYRDIILSILEKQDYEIELNAIDPASDEKKLQKKYDIWARKQINDILTEQQILSAATGSDQEIMPETREELEIYMSTFKLSTESAIKSVLDLTFALNKWPEIAKLIRADLFDLGIGGCREYVDKNGKHKIRYVDPVNLFVKRTRMPDMSGSNCIGEVIEMTVSDLYSEVGDAFTIDEYKKIIQSSAGKWNNPIAYFDDFIDTDSDDFRLYGLYGFLGKYGDYKVKVFDACWFTIDEQYYEQKMNAAGEWMTYDKPYGYYIKKYKFYTEDNGDGSVRYYKQVESVDGGSPSEPINMEPIEMNPVSWEKERVESENKGERRVRKSSPVMVYGCKWIIGTEQAYDYGKMKDIARDNNNLSQVYLPYHLYRVSNKSYVDRMIPFADAFMLSWIKLQNAKAQARPNGLHIEIDALENLSINGKDFTPLQALAVYTQTGNLIYKGTGVNGDPTRHRPVENSIGGMGQMWQELVGDINFNIEMIRNVTGFNEVIDASSPEKGTSVQGTQLSLNSANNALYPLISAFKDILERTAKSSALKFQMISRFNKLEGLEEAIGSAPRKIIEIGEDMSMLQMGIKIEAKPSEQKKEKVINDALIAMNSRDESGMGQITYADYLFIMRIIEGGNLRYAEAVLSYRIEKRMRAKQEMAQKNVEMNAKVQQQSLAQKAQADQELEAKATQSKLILIEAQANADIRVNDHKLSKTKEIEELKSTHKLIAGADKNSADIQKKVIESDTKLATHGQPIEKS